MIKHGCGVQISDFQRHWIDLIKNYNTPRTQQQINSFRLRFRDVKTNFVLSF